MADVPLVSTPRPQLVPSTFFSHTAVVHPRLHLHSPVTPSTPVEPIVGHVLPEVSSCLVLVLNPP